MDKNEKFEKLCLSIWQENPQTAVIVKVGSTDTRFVFAIPGDKVIKGEVTIEERDLMRLIASRKIAARIIKQRGSDGSYVIPSVAAMERDAALDY